MDYLLKVPVRLCLQGNCSFSDKLFILSTRSLFCSLHIGILTLKIYFPFDDFVHYATTLRYVSDTAYASPIKTVKWSNFKNKRQAEGFLAYLHFFAPTLFNYFVPWICHDKSLSLKNAVLPPPTTLDQRQEVFLSKAKGDRIMNFSALPKCGLACKMCSCLGSIRRCQSRGRNFTFFISESALPSLKSSYRKPADISNDYFSISNGSIFDIVCTM